MFENPSSNDSDILSTFTTTKLPGVVDESCPIDEIFTMFEVDIVVFTSYQVSSIEKSLLYPLGPAHASTTYQDYIFQLTL